MYLLKPIEQGLDVKITGGIHTGCLRLQAGVKTDVKRVADLRGKRFMMHSRAVFGTSSHPLTNLVLRWRC
jgi:hypothetical protein